jgi:hypothetical protein
VIYLFFADDVSDVRVKIMMKVSSAWVGEGGDCVPIRFTDTSHIG